MENIEEIKDFKIIAIRPLKGCNPKFLKILDTDEFYKFYNDYHFELKTVDGKEIVKIKHIRTTPEDLFKSKNNPSPLNLNISAIVGKNGSGKSTLIELLFVSIFNLALNKRILKNNKNIEIEKDIKVEIYYSINDTILCLKIDSGLIEGLDNQKAKVSFSLKQFKDKAANREFLITNILDNHKDLINEFFFYTIAVNYSIYSLNSDEIGNWIAPLFHKNDAYQTPLVINPMRTNGNIDIKVENDLVKQRLLANLLEPVIVGVNAEDTLRNLAKGKVATKLKLKFNYGKIDFYDKKNKSSKVENGNECVAQLFHSYTGTNIQTVVSEPEFVSTEIYVLFKLVKICKTYKRYALFFKKNKFEDIDKLVQKICDDDSHITFKIKQALNFLKHQLYLNWNTSGEITIDIDETSKFIEEIIVEEKTKGKNLSTIELIPPSIFKTQILFEDESSFDDFSSGEKQKIHSITSIVYHLINLNSIFNNGDSKNPDLKKTFKYKYINVIFDEVELYFHPDLQRTFIKDLIDYIGKINISLVEHIKGINFCFATHSPFILSDIPSANVMYLEVNEVTKKSKQKNNNSETFGANIHDLLANDFFMKDGFMGEYAKTKILSAIEYLDKSIVNPELLIDKTNNEWTKDKVKSFIGLIGEPLIKNSVNDMYFTAFGKDEIQKEIDRLTELRDK